ncbi:Gfo/Idh/MocA family oxidoreductase [Plantibacter flavus]
MGRAHLRAWAAAGLAEHIAYRSGSRPPQPDPAAPRAQSVAGVEAILADDSVGIVSVCTPTDTHADIAIRALERGKHVLLEKPIARTLQDAERILSAAEHSGSTLMVAHVVRFFGGYAAIADGVRDGVVGVPEFVTTGRLSAPPGPSAWWHDERRSGGILVDVAIHDADQLNLHLGTPVRVDARRRRFDGPIETTVEYRDGGLGRITSSMGMPDGFGFSSAIEVVGDAGVLGHRFTGSLDGTPVPLHLDAAGPAAVAHAATAIDDADPYRLQAEYFLECVSTGARPTRCPPQSALQALAVVLAAERSLATGRAVHL